MSITDVIIFRTTGIPIVARCYGGEYCKLHPDHALVTGFLSAMNTFGKELTQEELEAVIFDELSLVMDTKEKVMLVLGIDKNDNLLNELNSYQELADSILDEFIEKFSYLIPHDSSITTNEEEKVIQWLDSKIGENPMGDLKPKFLRKKESLWSKLKKLLIYK